MKHFLLCPACNAKIPVETSQAGQVIGCNCGQQIDVPSIRQLRQLDTVDDQAVAPPAWNRRKGVLFLGSAIMALAAVVAIALVVLRPSTDLASVTAVPDEKQVRQEVDALPIDESFVRISLMQPWPPMPFSERQKKGAPLNLSASSDLISRFEGSGPQFLASHEAAKVAQKMGSRNYEMALAMQTRERMNDWLLDSAVLGGIGLIVACSSLFLGDDRSRNTRRQSTSRKSPLAKYRN